MTVYFYTGTPGSGKSLDAADTLCFQLSHKRPVIGNFEIFRDKVRNSDLFTYIPNERLTPDAIRDVAYGYWRSHPEKMVKTQHGPVPRENYITVIIDECQLLFNSREWAKASRMGWIELLSQSRKLGLKVILVTQMADSVDKQFRGLVEYEVLHRKMSTAGLTGWLLSLPFLGMLFVKITYYYQMKGTAKVKRLESSWFVPRPRALHVYDSYATFDRVEDALLPLAADPTGD